MNTLERWSAEGKVQLDRTFRLRMETAKYVPARAKMERMNVVAEPAVADVSFYDTDEIFYADVPGPQFDELSSVLFPGVAPRDVALDPNRANDVMHLVAHASGGGAIFVTQDEKDFIKGSRREQLREAFGIVVMTPEEAVAHLADEHGWRK
ncbi:MAG: hypothetical protein KC501_19140 [Myxococcales bacterium]|nr:hypothetical protein [Myxococcales bacterium]